jgi:hypothetical protein
MSVGMYIVTAVVVLLCNERTHLRIPEPLVIPIIIDVLSLH